MHPQPDLTEQVGSEHTRKTFSVKPTRFARRTGKSILKADELAQVLDQLRLLRYWPPIEHQAQFESDLDYSKLTHRGQVFYELRFDYIRPRSELRVFFWVHDEKETIWIVDAYWKKTQKLEASVKEKVARRVRTVRGAIQDGMEP